jgi:medium-chain acyl-[acyl-carrier-protein] hydrolase
VKNVWISGLRGGIKPRVRLFCLPYAGGGAIIFRGWSEALPAEVEVCPIQLPGREQRFRERPITDIAAMVEVLAPALWDHLDVPFAFFGHSMGASIAYETARRLLTQGRRPPQVLLVSGRQAPHLLPVRPPIHHLPDDALVKKIRELNGTPSEVLEHPELVQCLMPLLRADFKLAETYRELDGPRLACPVVAFGGWEDDQVPPEQVKAWRESTSGPFTLHMLSGDHFFVTSEREHLLGLIAEELRRLPP